MKEKTILEIEAIDQDIDINLENAEIIDLPPKTEQLEVNPTTEEQVFTPTNVEAENPSDRSYYDKVTVKGVTKDIDSNIVPENIKGGVTILGVEGNVIPDKPDQTKTVVPTEEEQTVRADVGFELGSAVVKGIPKDYVGSGVLKQGATTYKPSLEIQKVNAKTYLTGDITFEALNLQEKVVTPSETEQVVETGVGFDGMSKVTVNAIPKNYVGSEVPKEQAKTIKPTLLRQLVVPQNTFAEGNVEVDKVSSDIDSNIKPENIKEGVSILGVGGLLKEKTLGTKDITVNGNYKAVDSNVDGFSEVNVNIPTDTPEPTKALVYTLATDGDYYIVGTGANTLDDIKARKGTQGSGLDKSLWKGGVVVIPDTYNGKPVKGVVANAFSTCKLVNGVILGKNIKAVGDFMCRGWGGYGNQSLAFIKFNDGIEFVGGFLTDSQSYLSCVFNINFPEIKVGMFSYNRSLKYVDIKNTLEKIGRNAFINCNQLEKIDLGSGIKHLDENVFQGCDALKYIILRAITPPTLVNLNYIQDRFVYVPDESVEVYKTASVWSKYDYMIKPISQLKLEE